jgi:dienelactone hydrolase
MRAVCVVSVAALLASSASALPSPPRPEHNVTDQQLVYQVPGMDKVAVKSGVPYKKTDSGELKLDIYYPADFRDGARVPAVVFINGVGDQPDNHLKDWPVYRSWARLMAASGWIAVTFDARGPFDKSAADIADLFRFLRTDGARLGVDADRIAAWVCSGNVVSGLPFLMDGADRGVRGAVVYYGDAKDVKIRTDLPLYYARAGKDNPGLNARIDALWARAVAAGAPWTMVNAPTSHHAFDVLDDTEESRRIVKDTVEFVRLVFAPPAALPAPAPARQALAYWFGREYAAAAKAYADYVADHPDDAIARMRLGLSQAYSGDGAQAPANLEKAVAMGADSPTDLYNVACGYAVLKQPEKALDWLDKAVAAGFRNRRLIESDEDLESLRETPRFQKIVSGLPA